MALELPQERVHSCPFPASPRGQETLIPVALSGVGLPTPTLIPTELWPGPGLGQGQGELRRKMQEGRIHRSCKCWAPGSPAFVPPWPETLRAPLEEA